MNSDNEEKKEKIRAYRRAWYRKNKEKVKARARQWREDDPDRAKATAKATYEKNKEKRIESVKSYYEKNKEQCLERNARMRAEHPEWQETAAKKRNTPEGKRRWRHHMLKNKYGITLEEYESILDDQNNVCAICREPEKALTKKKELKNLAVDHCHETGVNRGLLCTNCNMGIGQLRHSIELLEAGIAYLKEYEEKE